MSDDKKQLGQTLKFARKRVRSLEADLLRLEGYPESAERAVWIEAKRRVLKEAEVFLMCVESIHGVTE